METLDKYAKSKIGVLAGIVFAAVMGLTITTHKAAAQESVNIGGYGYNVAHDGQGPYVAYDGGRYYADGGRVLINGQWYYLSGYYPYNYCNGDNCYGCRNHNCHHRCHNCHGHNHNHHGGHGHGHGGHGGHGGHSGGHSGGHGHH